MSDTLTTPAASADQASTRLDQHLAACLPDLSRARVQQLIEDGQVSGPDGATITLKKHKVQAGDVYTVNVPGPTSLDIAAENIPLHILYEDEHLIVLDKTPDMAVHPAPGHWRGTLVNALLYHCQGSLSGIGGRERPGIVHRLDLGTSGVMVVAKTDKAHRSLSKQFAARANKRLYMAVCYGAPTPREGDIEGNIGRSPQNRKKMAIVGASQGKEAKTHYKVTHTYPDGLALVELKLHTGRTHQIRVHMASQGHPLVGDPMYGRKRTLKTMRPAVAAACQAMTRQALHAKMLGFTHPETGKFLSFTTEPPADMQALLAALSSTDS